MIEFGRFSKRQGISALIVAVFIVAAGVGVLLASSRDGSDAGRSLRVPRDYQTSYTNLGTWAVASTGSPGSKEHHTVYASPGSVQHYRKNGRWADGDILVKEVMHAVTTEMTTGTVSRAGDPIGWFVMVKDGANSHPGDPLWGDGWGWAWLDAGAPDQVVTKDYKAECLQCHMPAQATDWVYVEGYPVLGDRHTARPMRLKTMIPADTQAMEASAAVAPDGQKLFLRCQSCHSLTPGQNKIGPSLAGIVGRKAGTLPGYAYSPAMKASDITWTSIELSAFIERPQARVPGTKMAFAGIKGQAERKALIDFLETKK